MVTEEIIGLDVGQKQTGVARASSSAGLAEPLSSLKTTEVVRTLKDMAEKKAVDSIVVGLPRSLTGDDTAQTAWVRGWVSQVKKEVNLPFYWQDEALTSQKAKSLAPKAKNFDEHAFAAAVILQDFLDTTPAERVIC